ncbi:MAG: DEAD/DEAH box helicase [Bacteroidales bacterium]|nr:DEAD/DEAH box helicase [Bacteroidales bacterium]
MAKQEMSFKKLYVDSKSKIAETVINMWKENSPKMVERYDEQLKNIIIKCISDNIVVENMAHWEPAANDLDWRYVVNEKIWRKRDNDNNIVENKFTPYKHQYESWKTLLDDNKSIVVTSGTGSGKTECFMVPLVHDLTKNQDCNDNRKRAVEALFLYPLNALMEDQKQRMDNYITFSERDLKFAVYNGNTPENENSPKFDYERDDNGNIIKPYQNEILTRDEIRRERPNILFTNPSMLEYMLLRKVDSDLFTKELKWIVIDETHTYKGSAGAELAMLIRRVLKACGKDANDIKFATSSATIGSGDKEAKSKLKEFISNITGQELDKIEVIEGRRTEPKVDDGRIKNSLKENDFVLLKDLISEGTIEEKLAKLDELADAGLRIRLHYYLQTLNMGLFVDPRKVEDGKFVLSNTIPLEDGKLDKHYLDAYYCKECGAVLGYGEMDNDHKFSRKIQEEVASLEDYAEEDDNNNDGSDNANVSSKLLPEFYVGINDNNEKNPNDGLWKLEEEEDKFVNNDSSGIFKLKHVDLNNKNELIHYCPCCGVHGTGRLKPMRSFHMSADYISRLIAPILLEQTSPANVNAETLPCQGRKYIAFADSRQSAAGPTLKQNLETEEVWVTGVLYNWLRKCAEITDDEREKLSDEQRNLNLKRKNQRTDDEQRRIEEIQLILDNVGYLTWCEALGVLRDDKRNFERMFLAFAKQDDRNDEKSKNEYALSALYRVMARNGANGKNSPENWGLICTHYPALDNLKNRTLPLTIEKFNSLISDDNLKITPKDWYDYVKIFIDYDIRRHERFFFQYDGNANNWNEIDYGVTRQYRTETSNRRPIDGEESRMQVGDNRYTKLLLKLLGKEKCADLNVGEKEIVSGVIEQLKKDLEAYEIKEVGQELNWRYDEDRKKWVVNNRNNWVPSKNNAHYMNLSHIAFKLYDEKVWFDNNLRIPVSTTFKGYSPERRDNQKYDVKCEKIDWKPYNKNEESKTWFKENRKPILHKWTSKLEQILDYSDNNNTLYVQAEHTAQVARSIIKEKTDEFKKGEINIMACSTTMEMGVDLGDLELVLMNNVPPHPANYKQRAGRAGRGDQNKSASVTICGCDASGNALMHDPLKNLICAPIEPPKVDLTSPQLIQRHINSYLLRKYFNENGIRFNPGMDAENDNGYKLFKFFTEGYEDIAWDSTYETRIVKKDISTIILPINYESIIKSQPNSAYNEFISKLDGYATDPSVIADVESLVKDTFKVEADAVALILNTKYTIEKIAKDLDEELKSIQNLWESAGIDTSSPNDPKTNPWKRLNYSFTSILSKNLLSYLSTHQFTPNANMPVGIVEMVIDDNERHSTENPSRDMRTALSEYAPGKMVFINGVTYLMGGVKWNYSQKNQKLRICSNGHTWLGETENCPKCKKSAIDIDGFGEYMDVMIPTGFYPYKDTSRITQKDAISLVLDTALIGVGNWKSNPDDQRLYMIRTNEDNTNSQILYYNKGLGRGYYVCKECGYAVPVHQNASGNEDIQKKLYPIEKGKEKYHNYRGRKCKCDDSDTVLKNVVFGGAMQTDYCEIALFDNATQRMQYSETNNHVAYTLGLILCREFAKRKNCDGSEFDFIVRRQDGNLSICIFDTAKGGVGYSKSINGHVIDELFDRIREMLKDCTSADKILDRTTMRKYADFINVKATYEWLDSEYKFRKNVPKEIKNQLPNARVSCYSEVEYAIKNIQAGEQCALFFNGKEINKWNYNERDVNWLSNRSYLNNNCPQQKTFAVYNMPVMIASSDEEKMGRSIRTGEWKKIDNPLGNLFPLAQIGSTLYFTDKKEYSALNGVWASGYVYSVDYEPIDFNDLNVVKVGDDHYTFQEDRNQRKSDSLFDELYENSNRLRDFITACNGHKLSFTYHEEYLRTHLGMTITLQFIREFAKKAESQIELIKIVGEEYDDSRLYNDWNYDVYERPNKLYINCLNHDKRDDYVIGVFLEPMLNNEEFEEYEVESVQEGRLPHWRALIVKDETTGAVINILPNGGFANGWEFDNREFKQGGWFPSNCDIDTAIPIKISDSNGLLYDIKVGELK